MPFPEELVFFADAPIFTLALAMGGAIIIDRPLCYYRQHSESRSHTILATSQTRAEGLNGLGACLTTFLRGSWSLGSIRKSSIRWSKLLGSSSNAPSSSSAKGDGGRYFEPNCKDFARITNIRTQDMCCSHGLSVSALCCCRLAAFISCSTGMAATTLNAFEICSPEHNQRCLLLFWNGAQLRNVNHSGWIVIRSHACVRCVAFLAML